MVKQGNRLKYIDLNGEEHVDYRKQWTGPKLDLIMSEYNEKIKPVVNTNEVDVVATVDQIEEEAAHE